MEKTVAIQNLKATFTGINPLLMNNPQAVDPLNRYAKEAKKITGKRKKTDDDIVELRRLEVETKLYFDDVLKVYVPTSWVIASVCSSSWNRCKIKKGDIRAAVFPTQSKAKLYYKDSEKVQTKADIYLDYSRQIVQTLKQQQVRIIKAHPKFDDWSFSVHLDFDDTIINPDDLMRLIEYGAKFGGFGDFRPTYGRAYVEFEV